MSDKSPIDLAQAIDEYLLWMVEAGYSSSTVTRRQTDPDGVPRRPDGVGPSYILDIMMIVVRAILISA